MRGLALTASLLIGGSAIADDEWLRLREPHLSYIAVMRPTMAELKDRMAGLDELYRLAAAGSGPPRARSPARKHRPRAGDALDALLDAAVNSPNGSDVQPETIDKKRVIAEMIEEAKRKAIERGDTHEATRLMFQLYLLERKHAPQVRPTWMPHAPVGDFPPFYSVPGGWPDPEE